MKTLRRIALAIAVLIALIRQVLEIDFTSCGQISKIVATTVFAGRQPPTERW
jgi:hypothetical protein